MSNLSRTCLMGLALLVGYPSAAAPTAVTNTTSKTATISAKRLKKMFLGKKRAWPGGAPITLVLPPKGSAEMKFICDLVGMPEDAYRRTILERFFRGVLSKPVKVSSGAKLRDKVASTKGALSALVAALVDAEVTALKLK